MKKILKKWAIKVFDKFIQQAPIQKAIIESYKNYGQPLVEVPNKPNPYGAEPLSVETNDGESLVIITGRFRSGSTLLWNLFRKSDEFTAFYEPFNERQWFNKSVRGDNVDSTHRGVKDYWLEYEELDYLTDIYNESWIRDCLYMHEKSYNPNMKLFIDKLSNGANNRPVLQFNRVDFRLPWLKCQYPAAKILHLYRNPRDQWCSFLLDKQLMNSNDVQETFVDSFYLDVWCDDLYKHFPFLHKTITPHPYKRFYYLWKLSYLFGLKYADLNVSYEDLVTNTNEVAKKIGETLNTNPSFYSNAESIIDVTSLGVWHRYADNDWFEKKELECEKSLGDFLTVNNKF